MAAVGFPSLLYHVHFSQPSGLPRTVVVIELSLHLVWTVTFPNFKDTCYSGLVPCARVYSQDIPDRRLREFLSIFSSLSNSTFPSLSLHSQNLQTCMPFHVMAHIG
jgi:hypothetical protein